jgi:hypothetical protein
MSNKNIFIGYSQNDFLYSRFSPPSQFAGILGSGRDAVSSGRCSNILDPANKAQFKADIKNNLQLYLQNIDLTALAQTYQKKTAMFDKNGNIMFDASGTTYDYSGGSGTITYRQNGLGELDGRMNINYVMPAVAYARINVAADAEGNTEADAVFVDPGTVVTGDEIQTGDPKLARTYFTSNSGQPKCMITEYCTKKHWHYAKYNYDATTADGKCKCIPSGGLVYSADPHVHCTVVDTSTLATTTDSATGATETDTSGLNLGLMSAVGDMRRINVNLNAALMGGRASGSIAANINSDDIVDAIYDYYVAICNNKNKAEEIQRVSQTNLANTQLFEDANTSYFQTYANVLNMSGGILFVSYYIYYLFTKR